MAKINETPAVVVSVEAEDVESDDAYFSGVVWPF